MKETIEAFLERKEEEVRTGKIYPCADKGRDWRNGYITALVEVMDFFGMAGYLATTRTISKTLLE